MTRINIGINRKRPNGRGIEHKTTHIETAHDWDAEFFGAIGEEVFAHVKEHYPGWLVTGYAVAPAQEGGGKA